MTLDKLFPIRARTVLSIAFMQLFTMFLMKMFLDKYYIQYKFNERHIWQNN